VIVPVTLDRICRATLLFHKKVVTVLNHTLVVTVDCRPYVPLFAIGVENRVIDGIHFSALAVRLEYVVGTDEPTWQTTVSAQQTVRSCGRRGQPDTEFQREHAPPSACPHQKRRPAAAFLYSSTIGLITLSTKAVYDEARQQDSGGDSQASP